MLRSIMAVLTLALAAPVFADGPNWTYIEGGYQNVELDGSGFDVDGDGFSLTGFAEIGDKWHVFGTYNMTGFDFDVDLDELYLGGGIHVPMSPNVDFVANLAYVRWDLSSPFVSVDDDGFGVQIGARGIVADRWELAGYLEYVDFSDGGDDTAFRGQGFYNFTDTFAAGAFASFSDDISRYGICGRLYFGQ